MGLRASIQSLVWLLRPPVFVFQMGKVGSSSVVATVRAAYAGMVVQAHGDDTLTARERSVLKWRRRLGLSIYVVCPVRDPISRNVSSFFQNFERMTDGTATSRAWTMRELRRLFLHNYPHGEVIEWFENLRASFGIDVLAEEFPIRRKWQTYRRRGVRVLVYRVDLPHDEQLHVLSSFLGLRLRGWTYVNMTREKEHGGLYDTFLRSVKLPRVYVSIMCRSRLCRRFWNRGERQAMAARWTDAA